MNRKRIYKTLASVPHSKHYLKRYFRFIIKCQYSNTILPSGSYLERHHILPSSMFPDFKDLNLHPWNKASLTPRQHFIAHHMLARAFGYKMWYAFHMMCYAQKGERRYKVGSRIYEELKGKLTVTDETKEKISKTMKNIMTDDMRKARSDSAKRLKHKEETKARIGDAHRNKQVSEETRKKISRANTGRKHSKESIQKRVSSRAGYTHSDETRKKISESLKKNMTKEARERISNSLKGHDVSEETRRKTSESIKKNLPEYTCPHCNKIGKGNAMKLHHFDNCKYKVAEDHIY